MLSQIYYGDRTFKKFRASLFKKSVLNLLQRMFEIRVSATDRSIAHLFDKIPFLYMENL